jgi:hypothetical protein
MRLEFDFDKQPHAQECVAQSKIEKSMIFLCNYVHYLYPLGPLGNPLPPPPGALLPSDGAA